METQRIELMELVPETSSNASGERLLVELEKILLADKILEISLFNSPPLSTSFLNSSFGALWEKYGDERLKGKVRITNFQASRKEQLVEYIQKIRNLASTR